LESFAGLGFAKASKSGLLWALIVLETFIASSLSEILDEFRQETLKF
jgi:hypothetical protein